MRLLVVDLLAERKAFGKEGVREIVAHFDNPEVFLWSPHTTERTEYGFGTVVEQPVDCDFIAITGSRRNVSSWEPWMDDVAELIRTAEVPIIGICFGHQIIAEALGGSVRNSPNGWHAGVDSISLNNNAYNYGEEGKKYNLVFSHQDEVQTLPHNATLIAGSETCPNGMFLIENHIFCTQGHIELDKKFARMIYDFRKNQIGNHKHQHACETLTMQTDEHEIVESLLEFLKK